MFKRLLEYIRARRHFRDEVQVLFVPRYERHGSGRVPLMVNTGGWDVYVNAHLPQMHDPLLHKLNHYDVLIAGLKSTLPGNKPFPQVINDLLNIRWNGRPCVLWLSSYEETDDYCHFRMDFIHHKDYKCRLDVERVLRAHIQPSDLTMISRKHFLRLGQPVALEQTRN